MEQGREKIHATRRTLYMPVLLVAAVLVACAAAVATLLAVSKEAEAIFPGKNGRIAFAFNGREPGSAWQIVTIKPNGTGEKRLTHAWRPISAPFLNSPAVSL